MTRPFDILKSACVVIDRAAEWIITVLFSLMVLIGGMQVIARYLLRESLSWSEESQKYLHIWMIFLAIPLAYRHGRHIGMNVLLDRLPPVVRRVFTVVFDLMWLLLGVAMVVYARPLLAVASRQTSPGLGFRMDYVYSCVVVGGAYLVFTAVRKLAEHVRNAMQPSNEEGTP